MDSTLVLLIVAAVLIMGGGGFLYVQRRRAAAPEAAKPSTKPPPAKKDERGKDKGKDKDKKVKDSDLTQIEQLAEMSHFEEAARLAMRLQLWDKAAQLYLKAEQPGNAAHCAKRGGRLEMAAEFYEQAGDVESAIRMWEKAGNHARARELSGDRGKHEDEAVDAPKERAINISKELQQEIDAAVEKKDHVRAAELYEQGGDRENAAEQLAHFAATARRPEIYADKIRALSPRVAFSMLRLATKGRPHSPENADLYCHLASLQHHFGNRAAAESTLDKLIAKAPNHARARALYEEITGEPSPHPDMNMPDTKAGPSIAELVALIDGRGCDLANIEVFYRLGLACLAAERVDDALRAFKAVSDVSPGYRDVEQRLKDIQKR